MFITVSLWIAKEIAEVASSSCLVIVRNSIENCQLHYLLNKISFGWCSHVLPPYTNSSVLSPYQTSFMLVAAYHLFKGWLVHLVTAVAPGFTKGGSDSIASRVHGANDGRMMGEWCQWVEFGSQRVTVSLILHLQEEVVGEVALVATATTSVWLYAEMSVELSAFLNSSNDHNKLPKQAEWLSFDYFFESIWEAKAQEKHNTRQIAKAKSPFWKSARLKEGSSFCLICIDFCSDNVLYLLILSGGPEFILLTWSLCPTVTSSHIDILAHAQIVGLFIKQHFTSGRRSKTRPVGFSLLLCRQRYSETSGANARHLWLVLSCSPLLFYSSFRDFCTQTMSSALGFFSSWTAETFNDVSDELDLSWKAQVNQVRRITVSMASCQMLHICSKSCVLWSFRTQLLSFAVLRLFGAIVLVTKTSAQVGSSWHHTHSIHVCYIW